MLTTQEENALKRLAQELTPTPVLNPENTGWQPRGPSLSQMTEASLRRCPQMKVIDPNTDHAVEHRIKHVLRTNEKLMEFYSRVGLGRAQILSMSKEEISLFVENAERNAADDVKAPVARITFAPGTRPAAPRFLMVG